MNKCFITKLPSSVDNDNLPVLGQLRINWLKQNNLTDNASRAIQLGTNDSITVKVSGAHFTDDTLASNLGSTKTITNADGLVWLWVSNDADAILTIDNKYSLTCINFVRPSKELVERAVYFDIDDIRYCTNLTQLVAMETKISGDIDAISNLTTLENINLIDTQVSGDISAISNLTKLTNIGLSNTKVSGDISALSKLTNLSMINLSNLQLNGDVSVLSNIVNLTDLSGLQGNSLTGDMSKIPANVSYISQGNRKIKTNFTWTANGRQNATLLTMSNAVPFDTVSMDNMLIDQATCTYKPSSATWKNVIDVKGTRTSASDAAVTSIQNKGVTIIGVTKQA